MEKSMRTIQLNNRYKSKISLVEFEEDMFYLEFEDEQEWNWCRVGLSDTYTDENPDYVFIDPSGGPFMSLGDTFLEIPGKKITQITEKRVEGCKNPKYILKFS